MIWWKKECKKLWNKLCKNVGIYDVKIYGKECKKMWKEMKKERKKEECEEMWEHLGKRKSM